MSNENGLKVVVSITKDILEIAGTYMAVKFVTSKLLELCDPNEEA